jgi:hypothetical protein
MTSVGRFMHRAMRYGETLRDDMIEQSIGGDLSEEIKDLKAITEAMQKIPSDLNAAPSGALSAADRMLATLQPEKPFILMNDSQRVMESIKSEHTSRETMRNMAPRQWQQSRS